MVTASIQEALSTLVEHFAEPFGDSSAIPTLCLSRMTSQHVTVTLSGDGADELFGGYRRYRLGVAEQRLRTLVPTWFRHSAIKGAARFYPRFDYLPRPFRAKATLARLSLGLSHAYFMSISTFQDDDLKTLLSPELRASLGGYSPRERFTELFDRFRHLPPLQQMQAVDLETYLPGDILVKVDRATMAYSLEARAPYLDHRLAELANRLPQSFKLRNGIGKYAFRQAMSSELPPETLTRSKMGFGIPIDKWFRTSLKATFESVVLQPEMEEYFSIAAARRLWNQHQSGWRDRGPQLWNLLILALWHARHRRSRATEELITVKAIPL